MSQMEQMREIAQRNFISYCHLMNPAFISADHHFLIASKLQECIDKPKRLIFSMPPRHGKSFLISQHFPTWYLGRTEGKSIISASYGQELATDFGRFVKNMMIGDHYQEIFNSKVSDDSKSKKRFNTSNGGSYIAVGRGGAITGRGGNLIIVDDLIKNEREARSEIVRQGIKDWWQQTLYTRLMPGGSVIVVATRWHEDDLTGWLLKESKDNWEEVKLPAINEEGEALWPDFYDIGRLEEIQTEIGSYAFQSLYQQHPTEPEGQIVKKKWLNRYEKLPEFFEQTVMSWDLTFKGNTESDFVVGQVWGRLESKYYLIDQVRGRWDFTRTIREFKLLCNKHPTIVNRIVEDAANGAALVSQLESHISGLRLWKPKTDKVGRVHAVTPLFEAGNVFVPQTSEYEWVEPMLNEWFSFPNGKNDDTVDAMTQALINLNQSQGAFVMGVGSKQY